MRLRKLLGLLHDWLREGAIDPDEVQALVSAVFAYGELEERVRRLEARVAQYGQVM